MSSEFVEQKAFPISPSNSSRSVRVKYIGDTYTSPYGHNRNESTKRRTRRSMAEQNVQPSWQRDAKGASSERRRKEP